MDDGHIGTGIPRLAEFHRRPESCQRSNAHWSERSVRESKELDEQHACSFDLCLTTTTSLTVHRQALHGWDNKATEAAVITI